MTTDENKERSATPNIQPIAQSEFAELNPSKALLLHSDVWRWNPVEVFLDPNELKKAWQILIVQADPKKRRNILSEMLAVRKEKIKDVKG